MTAIRATFDGKSFVPKQPVSLPAQSEALVLVDETDGKTKAALDAAVREYYALVASDSDDDAWNKAAAPESHRAWDED